MFKLMHLNKPMKLWKLSVEGEEWSVRNQDQSYIFKKSGEMNVNQSSLL